MLLWEGWLVNEAALMRNDEEDDDDHHACTKKHAAKIKITGGHDAPRVNNLLIFLRTTSQARRCFVPSACAREYLSFPC